jgi:hypothetical protein
LATLFAGLGAGFGLAVVREITENVVCSREELMKVFQGAPLLAEIPAIHTSTNRFANLVRWGGALAATSLGSAALGLAISHFVNQVM